MRKIASIGIVGIWTIFSGVSSAQMSTFPSPPPLSPPKSAPSQSANGLSGDTSSRPNANADGQGTNSGVTPNPSTSPDTIPATPANVIPVTAETLTSMTALDDKNTLQPGDRISFRVIEDRDPAVARTVTDTGEVDFPYVGRLRVLGLTCHQVALELKRLLEVDYYKTATVIVGLDVIVDTEKPVLVQDVVWVTGQVRQTGPVAISKLQPMTVSQIILRCGGFGDFADQRKVRLIRRSGAPMTNTTAPPDDDGQKGQVIDVKSVLEGSPATDPIVQPNDLIFVPKRLINF